MAQVVIDLSKAASIADMRGSRIAIMSAVLQAFIREFFDQNPLSHLGIIRMRGGVAERLTELSGSPVRPSCSPVTCCPGELALPLKEWSPRWQC